MMDAIIGKLSYFLLVILLIIIIMFLLGMLGFYLLFNLPAIDCFFHTAAVMTGLSLEIDAENSGQKIFVSVFALSAVALYLILIATLITYCLEPLLVNTPEVNSEADKKL